MTNPIIEYYQNGNISSEHYFLDGKRHRVDGPAYIYYSQDGKIQYEEYYLNDKHHREDGPAFISYYEDGKIEHESYYLNGQYHNPYGPAYIYYSQDGKIDYESYYLNGECLSKENFNNRNNKKDSCQGRINTMKQSNFKENLMAIMACLLVLLVVVILAAAKVEAYGGDPACLLIRCVKVIP